MITARAPTRWLAGWDAYLSTSYWIHAVIVSTSAPWPIRCDLFASHDSMKAQALIPAALAASRIVFSRGSDGPCQDMTKASMPAERASRARRVTSARSSVEYRRRGRPARSESFQAAGFGYHG